MRIRHLLVVLSLVSASSGLRAETVAPPSESDTLALLSNGQFSVLDRRYGAIQHAYEDGRISDEDLRAAFRAFYAADATLEAKYTAWVQHSPNSYVAHLARGIYFKKVGNERRGDGFISETSEEQIKGMEAAYATAGREFDASRKLDDRPLLTYLHSMDLRTAEGDKEGSRKLLDLAVSIDPHNFIVREKYMGSLQTRWGGSVDEMKAFLAECRKAPLSAAHLRVLEALVVEDEGWAHEYQDGDTQAALIAYLKAAKLNPANDCSPCGPLSKAADMLLGQHDYQGAVKLYSKVLASDSKSLHALDNRGYAELELRRTKAAQKDFLQAADRGDPYAQDMLGRMFLTAGTTRDPRKAAEWLKKAADQNYRPAKELLPFVLQETKTPSSILDHR